MLTPTPTPYRNLVKDAENEDLNADHLEMGIADAKARLEGASRQYHSSPSIPNETIYNKAVQDLLDRTNARDRAKTKARELEIQAKPTPTATPEPSSTPSRSPSSLQSILDAFMPSSEGATLAGPDTSAPSVATAPLGPTPPPLTAQDAVAKAGAIPGELRKAGAGKIGDKASMEEKDTNKITDTKSYLMDKGDFDSIGGAARSTPEWQRQEQGLKDLDKVIELEALRNSKKTSVDLSPLGSYLDYQNRLSGTPTDLASSLKGEKIEDDSFKNMSEVQRRNADMAKELINTVKAGKIGQYVVQDGKVIGYSGGLNIPKPSNPLGLEKFQDQKEKRFLAWSDGLLKQSDGQKAGLDSVKGILYHNNPADIGRIPLKLAIADMQGAGRVAVQEIMMEYGSPAFLEKYGNKLSLWGKGKMSGTYKQQFEERIAKELGEWDTKRKNMFNHIRSRAGAFGVPVDRLKELYPADYEESSYSKPPVKDAGKAPAPPAKGVKTHTDEERAAIRKSLGL